MAGARGETTILVDGREVSILFTNRALLTAENQLKRGILGVLQGFMDGTSGYTDLVTLLRVGMEAARVDARAGGKPVSNSDALDVLDAVGFTKVAGPVMEALSAVIGYSAEAESGDEDPNA
jgi:hypothetical protein